MTIHSNDGSSWLTRLKRIGEKSADNKQQVFNNLGHLLNSDMLKGQFQRLDGSKAVGIDRMTKAAYGEHLDENIQYLMVRIRRGTYHPKAARLTEIPKEDGSKRPLAISCIEDKLVQLGLAPIFPDTFYHLTHYWSDVAGIHAASGIPAHCADAIRYSVRTLPQGSSLPSTRQVSA